MYILYMSITSKKNISMLKELLVDHPLKKLNEQEFDMLFDKEIKRLHQNRFSYRSNLINMNKELLNTFQKIGISVLQKEQERKKREEMQNQTMHQQFTNKRRLERKRQQETSNFEKRLNDTKAAFDKAMVGKRPEEIDFTDKVQDKPIQSSQLDVTMSEREAELAAIMKQQTKSKDVEKWLTGSNNEKPNNVVNLKIDHASNIPVSVEPIPVKPILKSRIDDRRVRFNVNELSNSNTKQESNIKQESDNDDLAFFQKLKLKTENNPSSNIFGKEVRDILKTISENQMTIIQELKKLNQGFSDNLERNNKISLVENTVTKLVRDDFEAI